ncbi:MAG: A/G-specific adenine glycosylase [Oscillospiraceae bacterium]|nr:A/G-specific adenine glycosylase [Oscillospiraceae bacterium]
MEDARHGFAEKLLAWYDAGHRALPWRETGDPYAIWVSEIMLQQTRAETAAGYYRRFLARFPTVSALAEAPEQDVLKLWEGLGYYTRARNLQAAARRVMSDCSGCLPDTVQGLAALPGIGPYTAGAVAAIAFGRRAAAVDGNVERVVARLRGIRQDVGIPSVRRALRRAAEELVPGDRVSDYTNAMMELGATVCLPGTPDCGACPVAAFCDALEAGDADLLPRKQRGRAPRQEARGVAVVCCAGRVLVQRRLERLLHGMWQFPNALDAADAQGLARALADQGIAAHPLRRLGEARHVFTHIIWQMRIYLFAAETPFELPESLWADAEALRALPIPTAMCAAKQYALACLATP